MEVDEPLQRLRWRPFPLEDSGVAVANDQAVSVGWRVLRKARALTPPHNRFSSLMARSYVGRDWDGRCFRSVVPTETQNFKGVVRGPAETLADTVASCLLGEDEDIVLVLIGCPRSTVKCVDSRRYQPLQENSCKLAETSRSCKVTGSR
jgi:hypothetical protein